jgi:hypothetical protein
MPPKEKIFFNHLSDLFKVGTLIDRRILKEEDIEMLRLPRIVGGGRKG